MKGDASVEQIATLEDIFELNRDTLFETVSKNKVLLV